MGLKILAAVVALIAANTAYAQQIGRTVQSDLNGDGAVERFTLFDSGNGTADLQIENTGNGVVYSQNIAWRGGVGQTPELHVAPNGSVRIISMNEAIGRNRWHQTLTIAYRDYDYRVAGFTYSWYDTLNLVDNGECDLNLLSGRGFLTVNDVKKSVRTDFPALSVTAWTDETPIPKVCGIGG